MDCIIGQVRSNDILQQHRQEGVWHFVYLTNHYDETPLSIYRPGSDFGRCC